MIHTHGGERQCDKLASQSIVLRQHVAPTFSSAPSCNAIAPLSSRHLFFHLLIPPLPLPLICSFFCSSQPEPTLTFDSPPLPTPPQGFLASYPTHAICNSLTFVLVFTLHKTLVQLLHKRKVFPMLTEPRPQYKIVSFL